MSGAEGYIFGNWCRLSPSLSTQVELRLAANVVQHLGRQITGLLRGGERGVRGGGASSAAAHGAGGIITTATPARSGQDIIIMAPQKVGPVLLEQNVGASSVDFGAPATMGLGIPGAYPVLVAAQPTINMLLSTSSLGVSPTTADSSSPMTPEGSSDPVPSPTKRSRWRNPGASDTVLRPVQQQDTNLGKLVMYTPIIEGRAMRERHDPLVVYPSSRKAYSRRIKERWQVEILEEAYRQHDGVAPKGSVLVDLAARLQLQTREVLIWFKNERVKQKKRRSSDEEEEEEEEEE